MSEEEKTAQTQEAADKSTDAPKDDAAKDETATDSADTEEVTSEDAPVSQEEITGREAEEVEEEEVAEEDIEEIPHKNIRPGMVVRVHERIVDVSPRGEQRERIQIFQGIVLGVKGSGVSRTMTVRKDSQGWMVEKIYPLSSPNVTKIEVLKTYKVRRAKLNHLRNKKFKRKMNELQK